VVISDRGFSWSSFPMQILVGAVLVEFLDSLMHSSFADL